MCNGEWKTPSYTVWDYEYRCMLQRGVWLLCPGLSHSLVRKFILIYLICWKTKIANFLVLQEYEYRFYKHREKRSWTKPPEEFIIVLLVKHHASKDIWHVLGWNIKSCGFKMDFFLCLFCFCFSCQFADSVLGWSLLSLLLTSSWMFVAYSFLDFCCCLCIASYFCRCLQFYIQLEITHVPPASPLYRFSSFSIPFPFPLL